MSTFLSFLFCGGGLLLLSSTVTVTGNFVYVYPVAQYGGDAAGLLSAMDFQQLQMAYVDYMAPYLLVTNPAAAQQQQQSYDYLHMADSGQQQYQTYTNANAYSSAQTQLNEKEPPTTQQQFNQQSTTPPPSAAAPPTTTNQQLQNQGLHIIPAPALSGSGGHFPPAHRETTEAEVALLPFAVPTTHSLPESPDPSFNYEVIPTANLFEPTTTYEQEQKDREHVPSFEQPPVWSDYKGPESPGYGYGYDEEEENEISSAPSARVETRHSHRHSHNALIRQEPRARFIPRRRPPPPPLPTVEFNRFDEKSSSVIDAKGDDVDEVIRRIQSLIKKIH